MFRKGDLTLVERYPLVLEETFAQCKTIERRAAGDCFAAPCSV